jgi:hypothetical protein
MKNSPRLFEFNSVVIIGEYPTVRGAGICYRWILVVVNLSAQERCVMTAFCFRSISSRPATQFERQNFREPASMVKASLFCAIVVCLSIVPFSGAAGQSNGVAVVGPTTTSTPYACTSAGINLAISDAISRSSSSGITQGVVDASNCTSMSGTAFNSEIDVGNASSAPVTLYMPCSGTWIATMTGGTAYALKVFNKSAAIGCNAGEGASFFIQAGATSNLFDVCGNDPSTGGYVRMEGFGCGAMGGAIIAQAICNFTELLDESYIAHMSCGSTFGQVTLPRNLWIQNNCCSARFEGINADTAGNPGTTPCQFESNNAIYIGKVSCVHPGQGKNNVIIGQNGGSNNHFNSIYMEQKSGQDTTTAWISVLSYSATSAADVFTGITANDDVAGSIRPMFELAS